MNIPLIIQNVLEWITYTGLVWCAILLFKKIFRNAISPKAHAAIWLILILRVVMPVTFDSGFHFIHIPVLEENQQTTGAVTSAAPLTANAGHEMQPQGQTAAAYRISPEPGQIVVPSADSLPGDVPEIPAPAVQSGFEKGVFAFWLCGVAVYAAVSIMTWMNLRRRLRRLGHPVPEELRDVFDACCNDLQIRIPVKIAMQGGLESPSLVFPNVVLLPADVQNLDQEQIKMAIQHELTHFRRKDHIKSLLLGIVQGMCWFNPFIHFAMPAIRSDIETACDADLVHGYTVERKARYAQTVLSMHGRTPVHGVVAMGCPNVRKSAEKRIRGIFMKTKNKVKGNICIVLLCLILGVSCFTTACQPTPEKEAVVNIAETDKETLSSASAQGELSSTVPQKTAYAMASYMPLEHWEETLTPSDHLTIKVNTDVLVPEAAAYPIEKVKKMPLTQERVDELIAYFAGEDAEFVQLPVTTTKEDYEALILETEKRLAQPDGEEWGYAEYLETLKQEWANAPSTAEHVPASTEFGPEVNQMSGEVVNAEDCYISIGSEKDGEALQIYAHNGSSTDGRNLSADFRFEKADMINAESHYRSRIEDLERQQENPKTYTLEEITDQLAQLREDLSFLENAPVDLDAAQERAQQILADLGLSGVQITSCEKACYRPYTRLISYRVSPTAEVPEVGALIVFGHETGGVPTYAQNQGSYSDSRSYEGMYCAPFRPDYGEILLDANGEIMHFAWNNMVVSDGIIQEDSEIISFEEARQRALDYMQWLDPAEGRDEFSTTYLVKEAKLVTAFVNVPNEPDAVMAVPAWLFKTLTSCEATGSNSEAWWQEEDILIDARSGATILMPGLLYDTSSGA